MARAKGSAPNKAETDEVQDPTVAMEAVNTEMAATDTLGTDMTVCEAVAAEVAEEIQQNRVIKSVKAGAGAAKEAVANFVPGVGQGIRNVAYKGVYYASFGVTFGALAVASLVPSSSFVGHAIAEGAKDAEATFKALEEKEVAAAADASMEATAA